MKRNKRAVVIVLDGVGIGALPDADSYGDADADTLVHTADRVGGLRLPHLAKLGIGNIAPIRGVDPVSRPEGAFGKMAERSAGKDTTSGHWELMGVVTERPFPTYPNGLPHALLREFSIRIGREVLGGQPASGTEIIRQLGNRHVATGEPIVYTSADSVFQVAAHEDVVPVERLYEWCKLAREMLTGEHAVARVIARPFTGQAPGFPRTSRRRDFALPPSGPTQLDVALDHGLRIQGVGKVDDIFAHRGMTACDHTVDNASGIETIIGHIRDAFDGILLANLNDTDTRYGHRNDPEGFALALEEFDRAVPEILTAMHPGDLLIITADHGCDPTTSSTDHSREYVPVLVTEAQAGGWMGQNLGIRDTLADAAATVASHLGIRQVGPGTPCVDKGVTAQTW